MLLFPCACTRKNSSSMNFVFFVDIHIFILLEITKVDLLFGRSIVLYLCVSQQSPAFGILSQFEYFYLTVILPDTLP